MKLFQRLAPPWRNDGLWHSGDGFERICWPNSFCHTSVISALSHKHLRRVMTARLSNASLAALSLPTVVFGGYELAQRILLPEFMTHTVGLDVGVAGLILTCIRLLDIVLDTVVGAMSDAGIGSDWGRRRAWMLLGSPIAVGGTFAVFTTHVGASPWAVFGWMAVMTMGWSMTNAAHGAWALESGSGLRERSRIFAARSIAGILGYLGFSALVSAAGSEVAVQVAWTMIAIAAGVALSTPLLFLLVPDPPAPRIRLSLRSMAAPLFLALGTREKRRLTLLFCLVGAHTAFSTGSFVYLVKYGVGAPDQVGPALLWQSIATVAGLPIMLWISHRIGPRPTLLLTFSIEATVGLCALLLPYGPETPVVVWAALRGFGAGMDFVLLRAYAGEELDEEARRTGASRAGAYYAAFHLYFNLANALATGALFGMLAFAAGPAGDSRLYVAIPVVAGAAICLLALLAAATWRTTGRAEHL